MACMPKLIFECSHTQAEVLSSMEDMKIALDGLRHRHSSIHSTASFAPNIETKEAMDELCRDLHRAGVTADIIRERKGHAVAAFQYPNAPPVVNQEAPQTTGSVAIVHGERLLKEPGKGKSRNPTLGADSTSSTGIDLKRTVQFFTTGQHKYEVTKSNANSAHDKTTLLHSAASDGHIDVVRQLLEQRENVEARRSDGSTPLHIATRRGHTGVVRLLLEQGANTEAKTTSHGQTPLDTASYNGHTDVVRLLLQKGANIEATRTSGDTALHTASWRGHVGVVSLLLEMGANFEVIRTDFGRTALHTAAIFLRREAVRLLLDKGANIHATSKVAKTALHYVFHVPTVNSSLRDSKQLIPTIAVLLAHGANILQKDNKGKTPFSLAEKRGYLEAKQLFLQHLKERNLKPPQKFR